MRKLLPHSRRSTRHTRPNSLYVALLIACLSTLTHQANASRHFRINVRAIEQILGRNVHAEEIFDVVVHGGVPRLRAALVSRGGMMYGPRGKYRLAEKVVWQGPETIGVGAALEGLLGRMARAMSV